MPHSSKVSPSRALRSVRYEIRGRLARRALELERQGYEILSLNINPNNPTGAVYSRECLTRLAGIAKENDLLILADEIYDQMIYGDAEFVPMATLCPESLCATFSGLSRVYRACGYRVGWVAFSGALYRSSELIEEAFRRIDHVLRHMANRPPMLESAR